MRSDCDRASTGYPRQALQALQVVGARRCYFSGGLAGCGNRQCCTWISDRPSVVPKKPQKIWLYCSMQTQHATPSKEQIALLPEFERLGPDRIALVASAAQAHQALVELSAATV